jgi:hypothetical protein
MIKFFHKFGLYLDSGVITCHMDQEDKDGGGKDADGRDRSVDF